MPDRWHFTGSDRIAPIYIVPALGWSITDHVSPPSPFAALVQETEHGLMDV